MQKLPGGIIRGEGEAPNAPGRAPQWVASPDVSGQGEGMEGEIEGEAERRQDPLQAVGTGGQSTYGIVRDGLAATQLASAGGGRGGEATTAWAKKAAAGLPNSAAAAGAQSQAPGMDSHIIVAQNEAASRVSSHVQALLRANSDVVTGVFMVAAFCWNFSLLTLVFPVALFGYALVANPGPGPAFWRGMLVYAELLIAAQYLFQTLTLDNCPQWLAAFIAHLAGPKGEKLLRSLTYRTGVSDSARLAAAGNGDGGQGGYQVPGWVALLGLQSHEGSFVWSVLPLFGVYLALLVQVSLSQRDGGGERRWTVAHRKGKGRSQRQSGGEDIEEGRGKDLHIEGESSRWRDVSGDGTPFGDISSPKSLNSDGSETIDGGNTLSWRHKRSRTTEVKERGGIQWGLASVVESCRGMYGSVRWFLLSSMHGAESAPHLVQLEIVSSEWRSQMTDKSALEGAIMQLLSHAGDVAAHKWPLASVSGRREGLQLGGREWGEGLVRRQWSEHVEAPLVSQLPYKVRVMEASLQSHQPFKVSILLQVIRCDVHLHLRSLTPADDVARQLAVYKQEGESEQGVLRRALLRRAFGGRVTVESVVAGEVGGGERRALFVG